MKNKISSFLRRNAVGLLAIAGAVGLVCLTGCADVGKSSHTGRVFKFPGMVSPQGAFTPHLTIQPSTNGVAGVRYEISYDFHESAGSNAPTTMSDLLKFRSVDLVDLDWVDTTKGGAFTVLADPKASQISSTVNNQSDLGGSHTFNVGDVSWVTSTNADKIITAGGAAIGQVIGQIVNSTTGNPAAAVPK